MYLFYLMKGSSAQKIKEASVPRKFNAIIIINNKIHHWMQDRKGQEL
jgi:hypothetical protein